MTTTPRLAAPGTDSSASPGGRLLAAGTRMGVVRLRVRDLAAELEFYTRGVGLHPLWERDGEIALGLTGAGATDSGAASETAPGVISSGVDAVEVVRLVHAPDLRPSPSNAAGLFHTAVVFSTRTELAAVLVRMFHHHTARYVGSADHLVSQAFYFSDPEGNGVELYWDRPRTEWTWQSGQVLMDSLPLDPVGFVREHLEGHPEQAQALVEAEAPALSGSVGHVHLQVGDTETARRFYVDVLGFEQTSAMGRQALFVSAGKYHHHMAMNTWNSAGAGPRASGLGLGAVDIRVPGEQDLQELAARLRTADVIHSREDAMLRLEDPWRNELRVTAAA